MTQENLERAASAAAELRQGDILELPVDVLPLLANLDHPLSLAAQEEAAEGGSGTQIVATEAAQVVLLTQTCDLQRTDAKHGQFFVVVAAVEDETSDVAAKAWRGHFPRVVGLPWLSETSIANLSRIASLERSVLVGLQPVSRIPMADADWFGYCLARFFKRAAIPDDVNRALQALQTAVKDKHDKDSAIGRRFSDLFQIRVLLEPDANNPRPDVTILFLLRSEDLPLLPSVYQVKQSEVDLLTKKTLFDISSRLDSADDVLEIRHLWSAWAQILTDQVRNKAAELEGVGVVIGDVYSIREINYERVLGSVEVDLAYLTERSTS